MSQKVLLVGWSGQLDFQFKDEFQKQLQLQDVQFTVDAGGPSWRRHLQKQDHAVLLIYSEGCTSNVVEICQTARNMNPRIGIILLSQNVNEIDTIIALELGVDYYLALPQNPRTLVAYVTTMFRRIQSTTYGGKPDIAVPMQRLQYGGLIIDPESREVTLNGERIDFSSSEFELLHLLASNTGAVISRQRIMEELRGVEYNGIDRSIDLRISRLRKRLGDNVRDPSKIKTIRGKGYLSNRSAW